MILNIINVDKILSVSTSCSLEQSFSERNFYRNLLPVKRRYLGKKLNKKEVSKAG